MPTDDEQLTVHPLFAALTRPPMVMGVTLEYLTLNIMVTMTCFIGLKSFIYLLLCVPLHAVGFSVCRFDTAMFTILYKKLTLLPVLPNQSIWGVRSYEPF